MYVYEKESKLKIETFIQNNNKKNTTPVEK